MLGDQRCGAFSLGDSLGATCSGLSKESPACLVLGRWCNRERVVLPVHKQGAVADFYCLDTVTLRRAVDFFECHKVKLFVRQDVVVVELISGLLLVELALEDIDFVGELL